MSRIFRSLEHFDPKIEATDHRLNVNRRRARQEEVRQVRMAQNINNNFGRMGASSLTLNSIPFIVKPNFGAENFELKPHLIQMVGRNQFGGHHLESPHDHIVDFVERCDTITAKDLNGDVVRLRLFPFGLRDKAKA